MKFSLTYTGAAFTVKFSEAVETFLAARTILQITLTGLCKHALANNTCTHCLIATVHSIHEVESGNCHHKY
jgi:hypothetical protein